MKKGVVLLITLFFIIAISTIIMKNLNDTDRFIKEVTIDNSLTQMKITNDNIQNEIKSIVSKNKEFIDEIIEIGKIGIPFEFEGIDLNIKLDYHNSALCNLNDINRSSEQSLYNICGEDIYEKISYKYDFLETLKRYNKFDSKSQVKYFLDDYITYTKDETIHEVKDNFGFLKSDENLTYIQCDYTVSNRELNASSSFIFDLNSSEVKSFDFSLRDF